MPGMAQSLTTPVEAREFVHGLLEMCLLHDELQVPMLPEVATRVLRAKSDERMDASGLAAIINADPALTLHVLKVAGSAAKRPATAIVTLPHAIAWLGLEEVVNIAFTLAVQGRLLEVPGQRHRSRGLWRHSLASALWAQRVARLLDRDAALCHLCGLLHNVGKVVTLGAVHDLARRAGRQLDGADYDTLIETFHRHIGARVLTAWAVPTSLLNVITRWEAYAAAGDARTESNIVAVAHRLADDTLRESTGVARELAVSEPAFVDLGLTGERAALLFAAAAEVHEEVDRYLAP